MRYFAGLAALAAMMVAGTAQAQLADAISADNVERGIYYSVERDYRRCISPLCGGFWLTAVNQRQTRCADGTLQDRCYVAEIDWSGTGLSEAQINEVIFNIERTGVLVFGSIVRRIYEGFGNLGELRARRVWTAVNDRPAEGDWLRLNDLGFVCVASPCFNIGASLINTKKTGTLSGLDFSRVGATPAQLEAARQALRDGTLIAPGKVYRTEEEVGTGRTLGASQIYLPVTPVECIEDDECGLSRFHSPVKSVDDCYCLACPVPISLADARENEAGYREHCADWRPPHPCPLVRCANPPPVGCVENMCSYID